MFLKNKNIIFKIRRSKDTDFAALKRNEKNVMISLSNSVHSEFPETPDKNRKSKLYY